MAEKKPAGAGPAAKKAPASDAVASSGRGAQRTMIGRIASNKMDKTVVVAVERMARHSLYGRITRRTRTFKAHDEANRCEVGDTVIIEESRPLSRDKHWRVQQILRRGTGEPVELVEEVED